MKLITLTLLIVFLSMSLAFAKDGNNWVDKMGDILTGKENAYFKGEAVKEFALKKSLFGLDKIQAGVYTKIEMSEPASGERYVEGGPTLRLIW